MTVTDQQVQLLMKNYEKTGSQEQAAAKAGMSRQTASKYLHGAQIPSEAKKNKREWRTREDPLDGIWDRAQAMLDITPELESKALFEYICADLATAPQENTLRTFQRRTRAWRATKGPEKEIFFQQESIPGKRMSLDFTHMNELDITISGEKFNHMLCHCALSYSKWECATVCFTENFLALKTGLQESLFRLGHVPSEIWTDNSTSATHKPSNEDKEERRFNQKYLDLTDHFGIKPQTINIGKSNENGCIESLNGHIKRRVNQHLLLRGSRDFASRKEYEDFLRGVVNKANDLRRERLREELGGMRELKVARVCEWEEERSIVKKWSTVTLNKNTYSVPSRLIGEFVIGHIFEDHIEIYYNGELQLSVERIRGRSQTRINYRHVIHSLLRKPGAFRNYRYMQELFPTLNFRKAYDKLEESLSLRRADMEYLRILKEAADCSEDLVDQALIQLLKTDIPPRWAAVKEFLPSAQTGLIPDVQIPEVTLDGYDDLIQGGRNE